MSYKTPSSRTRIQISKSEGSIPGAGERKLTVGGNDDVLDKMRVACQTMPRKAVVPLFPSHAMILLSQEEDRMRSGLSRGQAMAVTQPACPLRVPLSTSVSPITLTHYFHTGSSVSGSLLLLFPARHRPSPEDLSWFSSSSSSSVPRQQRMRVTSNNHKQRVLLPKGEKV